MDAGDPPSGMDEIRERAVFRYRYLNQREFWVPADGHPVLISDMEHSHRRNAARWLLRRARPVEFFYSLGELFWLGRPVSVVVGPGVEVPGGPEDNMLPRGDMAQMAFDQELDDRASDPERWLRTTELYLALLDGLPTEPSTPPSLV